MSRQRRGIQAPGTQIPHSLVPRVRPGGNLPEFDTAAAGMTVDAATMAPPEPTSPKKSRKLVGRPVAWVKHESASMPVQRIHLGTRTRFAISRASGREGAETGVPEHRSREAAGLVVERQIPAAMQHLTDLKPQEREAFLAAPELAEKAGLPLVPALEDCLRARQLAGTEPNSRSTAVTNGAPNGFPSAPPGWRHAGAPSRSGIAPPEQTSVAAGHGLRVGPHVVTNGDNPSSHWFRNVPFRRKGARGNFGHPQALR